MKWIVIIQVKSKGGCRKTSTSCYCESIWFDGCGVINADRFTLTTGQAVKVILNHSASARGRSRLKVKWKFNPLYRYLCACFKSGLYANELNTVLGQNDIQVKLLLKSWQRQQLLPHLRRFRCRPTRWDVCWKNLFGEQGLGVRNAGTINSNQSAWIQMVIWSIMVTWLRTKTAKSSKYSKYG